MIVFFFFFFFLLLFCFSRYLLITPNTSIF